MNIGYLFVFEIIINDSTSNSNTQSKLNLSNVFSFDFSLSSTFFDLPRFFARRSG